MIYWGSWKRRFERRMEEEKIMKKHHMGDPHLGVNPKVGVAMVGPFFFYKIPSLNYLKIFKISKCKSKTKKERNPNYLRSKESKRR